MNQDLERRRENELAWKICMESTLNFWCCGTSHQYIQQGYPKKFLVLFVDHGKQWVWVGQ